MADLDVTENLEDPDFTDTVGLITRSAVVNDKGKNVLTEVGPVDITAVVQPAGKEALIFLPEGVRLSDSITIIYQGKLSTQRAGGYSDVILWQGDRYEVEAIPGNWQNWGAGFTHALCILEAVNAG